MKKQLNYRKHACKFPPKYWNVSHLSEEEKCHIINKTNNPLERFNREYNEAINSVKPSMSHFVQTINRLSNQKVTDLINIKQKKAKKSKHRIVSYPKVPTEYYTWSS